MQKWPASEGITVELRHGGSGKMAGRTPVNRWLERQLCPVLPFGKFKRP